MATTYKPLILDASKLAKLLVKALHSINDDRVYKMEIKSQRVYKNMIAFYLEDCITEAIRAGHSISLGELGHVQVLEKFSRKNYEWDRIYRGKDWELVFQPIFPPAVGKISDKFMPAVLQRTRKGKEYSDEICNPELRLKELLNLLNGTEPKRPA